jgi:uncharacterized protein YneF (UPF0154 family)
MELSSKASNDVVHLFQALLVDEAIESDMDNIIDNDGKREELIDLLDCITDLDQNTSNSLHLLIIKLCDKDSKRSFIHSIADNPNISSKIIRMLTDKIINDFNKGLPDVYQSRSITYNKNTDRQVLHDLFVIDDNTTKKLIVKHDNADAETLNLFLNHKSIQVRRLPSEATHSSEGIQIKLLKQNDPKALEKLSKNPIICDEAIKFLLFSSEVRPTKKRLKTFLTDNPEYYNLKTIKLATFKPGKGIIVPEISEVKLKNIHLIRVRELS